MLRQVIYRRDRRMPRIGRHVECFRVEGPPRSLIVGVEQPVESVTTYSLLVQFDTSVASTTAALVYLSNHHDFMIAKDDCVLELSLISVGRRHPPDPARSQTFCTKEKNESVLAIGVLPPNTAGPLICVRRTK